MSRQYTSQAKEAIAYGKKIARKSGQGYIGTEHILVGLVHEKNGTAGMVLRSFDVDEEKIMKLIDKLIAPAEGVITQETEEYSLRAEKVIENSQAEAEHFKSIQIGTEHLLLALLKDTDALGSSLLPNASVSVNKARSKCSVPI